MKIDKIVTDDDLIEFLLDQYEQTKNPVFLAAANSIWLYRRDRSVLNFCLSESNKWISVEDRLPKKCQKVLCYYKFNSDDNGVIGVNAYRNDGTWNENGEFVTHWMPLPEPPTEKEN